MRLSGKSARTAFMKANSFITLPPRLSTMRDCSAGPVPGSKVTTFCAAKACPALKSAESGNNMVLNIV
jgi:hypothetical protein